MPRKNRIQGFFRHDYPAARKVTAHACAEWGRRGAPVRRPTAGAPDLDDLLATVLGILSRAMRAQGLEQRLPLSDDGVSVRNGETDAAKEVRP